MVDPAGALRFIEYRRRFSDLPLVLTEAGNQAESVPSQVRAAQYRRFARLVNRYTYVESVHYFILSGTWEWRRFFLDDQIAAALAEVAPGLRLSASPTLLPLAAALAGGVVRTSASVVSHR